MGSFGNLILHTGAYAPNTKNVLKSQKIQKKSQHCVHESFVKKKDIFCVLRKKKCSAYFLAPNLSLYK
jgi:hypothetical protein